MVDQSKYFGDLQDLLPRLERIPSLDAKQLEEEYIAILGRKQGALTAKLKAVVGMSPAERKVLGANANELKQEFEAAFEARRRELKVSVTAVTWLDMTMPPRGRWVEIGRASCRERV